MRTSLILIAVSLALGALYHQPVLLIGLLPIVGLTALNLMAPSNSRRNRGSASRAFTPPQLSKLDLRTVLDAALLSPGLLITAAIVIFYLSLGAFAGLLDATTAGIICPTAVLFGLIIAAGKQKGLFFLPQRFPSFLLSLALTIIVFKLYWMNCYWGDPESLRTDFVTRSIARAVSLAFDSIFSYLTVLPVVFLLDLWLHRGYRVANQTTKVVGCLVTSLITCTIVASLLPIAWLYLNGQAFGQVTYEQQYIARDALRFTVALSTISTSLAGVLIAFAGSGLTLAPDWRKKLFAVRFQVALILTVLLGPVAYLVIIIQSNLPGFYVCRGAACTIAGQYRKALRDINEAIRIDPSYGAAYEERAYTYLQMRRLHEGLADLEKAVNLGSCTYSYHYTKAINFCLDEKKFERIVRLCTLILNRIPNHSLALQERARAYALLGEEQKAKTDIDKCILLNPRNADAYLARGYMLEHFKRFELAFNDLSTAIYLDGSSWNAYGAYGIRGRALLGMDCPQLALKDLNKAIELQPRYERAYYTRALVHEKLGMADAAKKDLAKSFELGYVPGK